MRREFPDKVKVAAFKRCEGRCEIPWCGAKLFTGKFTYDHRIPDQLGGEPTLDNCQVICRECDKAKTRTDAANIARAKRRHKKQIGIKKRRTIRAWRKFNGDIVHASRER